MAVIALNPSVPGVEIHQTLCTVDNCNTRVEYTSRDVKKHKSKSYSHIVCPTCGHSIIVTAARKAA